MNYERLHVILFYYCLINEQNLTFELIPRKRISESKISIYEERYGDVLTLIPESLFTRAPDNLAEFLELRAQAFSGIGGTQSALITRTTLSKHLDNHADSANNQNEIWIKRIKC